MTKTSRIKLKEAAKKSVSEHFGAILVILLVLAVAGGVLGMLTGVGALVLFIVMGPVSVALSKIFLDLTAKNRNPELKDLLYGFDEKHILQNVLAYLRVIFFTFLWSLLFYIPGIIKQIAYSQTYYLMAGDPKLTAKEAQAKSIAMMDGHKWEYFVLQLSFIPWMLLTGITCGIAGFWVLPYMNATLANYHRDLLANYKEEQ